MRVTCESSEKCVQHHNLLNGGVSRFAKRFYDLGLDGRSLCPFKTATARLALASTLGTISLDRPREITHTHACRLLYSLEQGQAQFAKLSLSDTPQLVLFLLGISRRLSDDNSPILCARAHTHTHTHTQGTVNTTARKPSLYDMYQNAKTHIFKITKLSVVQVRGPLTIDIPA